MYVCMIERSISEAKEASCNFITYPLLAGIQVKAVKILSFMYESLLFYAGWSLRKPQYCNVSKFIEAKSIINICYDTISDVIKPSLCSIIESFSQGKC